MISLENEMFLEKNDIVVFRIDKNKNITYVNDSFPDLFLYEKDYIINKNIEKILHSNFPICIFNLIEKIISENNETWSVIQFKTKDNKSILSSVFIFPMYQNEKDIDMVFICKSINDEKSKKEIFSFNNNLYKIENSSGISSSSFHLLNFLQSKQITYDKYISNLIGMNIAKRLLFKTTKLNILNRIQDYDMKELLKNNKNVHVYRGQIMIVEEGENKKIEESNNIGNNRIGRYYIEENLDEEKK